jgi:hypothetical protein
VTSIRAELAAMKIKDFWEDREVHSVNCNDLDERRKEMLDEFFVRAALR